MHDSFCENPELQDTIMDYFMFRLKSTIKENKTDLFYLFSIFVIWFFHYRVWYVFTDRFYFLTNDTLQSFYPEHVFLSNSLKKGVFPWRNPFMGIGEFFPARLPISQFSPIVLLNDLIFPVYVSYVINSTIFPLIAGVGLYFFCRQIHIRNAYAFISAITYMGSGIMMAQSYHLNFIHPIALFPWILLFTHKLFVENRAWSFYPAGLLFAFMFLTGHPQFIFYVCIFISLYVFVSLIYDKRGIKDILFVGFLLLMLIEIGFCIGAFQLLSANSVLMESNRGDEIQFGFIGSWSEVFKKTPAFLLYFYFTPVTSQWLKDFNIPHGHLFASAFALSPFLLVVPGGFLLKNRGVVVKKYHVIFLVIFIISWILYLLLPTLGVLSIFHSPIRMQWVNNLSLCILLVLFLQEMESFFSSKGLKTLMFCLIVISTLISQFYFKHHEFTTNYSFSTPEYRLKRAVSLRELETEPQIIDWLKRDHEFYRVLPFRRLNNNAYDSGFTHTDSKGKLSGIISKNILPVAWGQVYNISSLGHYGQEYHHALSPKKVTRKIDEIYSDLMIEKHNPLLDIFNVKYVLSRTPLKIDSLKKVKQIIFQPDKVYDITESQPVYIYMNNRVLPRVFFGRGSNGKLDVINNGIIITHYSPNKIMLQVTNDHEEDIIVGEYYDRNWIVKKNDTIIDPQKVYDVLMRIPGPFKKKDMIILKYWPRIIYPSLGLTSFGLIQLLSFYWLRMKVEKRFEKQ